jgi:hypothetical protein
MACLLVAVAIGAYLRFGRADHFDGPEYIGQQPTADGGWRCPDGYSKTGKNWVSGPIEGAKQCRRKAESRKMQKHFRKSQIKAKKKCGSRPASTSECLSWKCKKSGDTSTWQCVVAGKAPEPSPQCSGYKVHDDGTCWNHRDTEDSSKWVACYGGYVGAHKCAQPK